MKTTIIQTHRTQSIRPMWQILQSVVSTKRKAIALLLLLTTYLTQAQPGGVGQCFTSQIQQPVFSLPPLAQNPQASCMYPYIFPANDVMSNLYVPNAAMPTLTFNINFIFMKDPVHATIFDNVPQSQLIADANNMVNLMNSWFSTCGSIPHTKPSPNPSPLLNADSKIRLALNNVYTFTSSLTTGSNVPYGLISAYPMNSSTTMNIYWWTTTNPANGGSGVALFGNTLLMAMAQPSAGATYFPGTIFNNPRLLWHEVCHTLGFLGDHYGYAHNIQDPALGLGYIPDDAAIDYGITSSPCPMPTSAATPTSLNNNVMAGTACREVLSSRQIAAFHYLVAKGITRKYTQFNGSNYPYVPVTSGTPITLTYSGTQTINSSTPIVFDSIIIPTGASVTVNSTMFWANPNAKVIVQKGAYLKLNCSTIAPKVPNLFTWEGIDVDGDDTQAQGQAFQGVLELNNSALIGAKTAVTLGKRNSMGQIIAGTGGGYVTGFGTFFMDNGVDVEFAPYVRLRRNYVSANVTGFAPMQNLSSFKSCKFTTGALAQHLLDQNSKFACVIMNDVYGVRFKTCGFDGEVGNTFKTDYAIYANNSSFSVRGAVHSNGFTNQPCVMDGFKNAVYANGNTYNDLIVVDSCLFKNNDYNSVFLANTNNTRVIRNIFQLTNAGIGVIPAGLYLNNSTNYQVEENEFTNVSGQTAGIFVRQSGAAANSIYNNKFVDCKLGLWAVGQNYDPNTGIGLTMNCNDFTNCTYDIGVAKTGKSLAAVPNFAGVAEVQGVAFTFDPKDNVRNTYHVTSCNTNDENKYNINTGNSFAITSHGSFIGQQFHPTPQVNNSCSNASELVDIVGSPALPTKVQYCPLSVFPGLSMQALNQQIGSLTQTLSAINEQQSSLIDGGDTQALLEALNNGSTAEDLRRLAMTNSPYLSDAVLNTYFTNSSVPYTDMVAVHNANKPVSPAVWQTLLNLNLPTDVMSELRTQQNVNGLSPKNQLLATQQLYSTRLGLSYNEKLSRLMKDTTMGSADSVLAIYAKNVLPNSDVLTANALIALGRYTEAKERLTAIAAKGALYADYVSIQREFIHINESPAYRTQVKADAAKREQVQRMAVTPNVLSEGLANSFLEQVYGIRKIDEEKPQPETPNGSRLMQHPLTNEPSHILLNDQVLVYPNPANSVLRVTNEGSQENTLLRLLDISGKVVISQSLKGNTELNTDPLNNGIYFIQLLQNDKLIAVKKVVIAH